MGDDEKVQQDKTKDITTKNLNEVKDKEKEEKEHVDLSDNSSELNQNTDTQTENLEQEQVDDMNREIVLLKKASETNFRKLQYLMADYDNYRKQMETLTEDRLEITRVNILSKVIDIEDDFIKAFYALKDGNCCSAAIVDGFNGILKNLQSFLKSEGIQEIASLGKPFDPNFHDPLSFVENNSQPEKTIVQVKRKGYMLKDKILRPSLVVLSRRTKIKFSHSSQSDDGQNLEGNYQ